MCKFRCLLDLLEFVDHLQKAIKYSLEIFASIFKTGTTYLCRNDFVFWFYWLINQLYFLLQPLAYLF